VIRQLLYALFVCQHQHQMKIRDDEGRLLLECLDCGNVAEAVRMSAQERRALYPTQRVTKPNVESIRDRQAR